MMRKRLVFVVGTLQAGGIERSVTDWCLYLAKNTSWEPVVICLLKRHGPFLQILENHGIRVEECKLHRRWFTLRFRQLLRELKPKVVHSQVAFSMPWQVLAMMMSGAEKIIFTQQNEYQNWSPLGARLRLRIYFFLFFRFIYKYTCVSERVCDSLCSLSGLSQKDFLVIPNSVSTEKFFFNPSERNIQRSQLRLSSNDFLVGMVGRFSPQKGHLYLVEAANILKQRKVNCKILLIGIGDLEKDIRQLVNQYKLDDDIMFYGQALNVNQVLNGLDCFILPSLWEGMPLALLEAMAAGVPVIGTDVAGTREVIKNKVNGLLIPARSSQAISEAIAELINDPPFRQKLAESAKALVHQKYSVEANMGAYLKLYEG